MKERIARLIKDKALTSQKFAEVMGVQPSNISHILSGRNMPSFDFIRKLLQTYPELNPDWLIMVKGAMYRSSGEVDDTDEETLPVAEKTVIHELDFHEDSTGTTVSLPSESLSNMETDAAMETEQDLLSQTETGGHGAVPAAESSPEELEKQEAGRASHPNRIERVLFFYDDASFEAYYPSEKRK